MEINNVIIKNNSRIKIENFSGNKVHLIIEEGNICDGISVS